jgi:hypothetical protein
MQLEGGAGAFRKQASAASKASVHDSRLKPWLSQLDTHPAGS